MRAPVLLTAMRTVGAFARPLVRPQPRSLTLGVHASPAHPLHRYGVASFSSDSSHDDGGAAAAAQRVLEVAIVGLPNAGKSSLMNTMLAQRVSAVSSKRNTTRQNLVGVASSEASGVQLIFYDTPGFLHVRDFQGKEEGSSREVGRDRVFRMMPRLISHPQPHPHDDGAVGATNTDRSTTPHRPSCFAWRIRPGLNHSPSPPRRAWRVRSWSLPKRR